MASQTQTRLHRISSTHLIYRQVPRQRLPNEIGGNWRIYSSWRKTIGGRNIVHWSNRIGWNLTGGIFQIRVVFPIQGASATSATPRRPKPSLVAASMRGIYLDTPGQLNQTLWLAAGTHGPPAGPVKPALHVQFVREILLAGDPAPCGHC